MVKGKSLDILLVKIFLLYYLIHPLVFFLTLITAVGFDSFLGIFKIISVLAPVIVALFTLLFYIPIRKLRKGIKESTDISLFSGKINSIPVTALILLTAGCTGGPLISVITGYRQSLFLSVEQCAFFFLIGLIQAFIAGGFLFFHLKIILYRYASGTNYELQFRPLTLFQKLVIPICSAVILMILIASAGVYKISYDSTYDMYSSSVSARIEKNSIFAGSLFDKALAQLSAYTEASEVKSMQMNEIKKFIRQIHKNKGKDIEMFFAADLSGNAPNSLGTEKNISNRKYFEKAVKTGKPVFSDPIINKQTGKMIVVAVVPVFGHDRKVKGVMGATILLARIQTLLARDRVARSGRFMIISRKGIIIYHPDRNLLGLKIGRDITDDGKKRIDTGKIMTAQEDRFFSYVWDGKATYSYKTTIPVINDILLFSMDRMDFIKNIRYLLIEIITAVAILSVILLFVIRYIARKFSVPIHNTINVIHRLSEGDLTAETEDFIADEFGELLRSFKGFQRKIRTIIGSALDATFQLTSSAEELATTSSNMSVNAQNQAASVEEASASMEEISGAVEMISTSASSQSSLAHNTFSLMENLKSDNEIVTGYAESALAEAKKSTEQANNGQRLMSDTISGMNKIDESTRRIAEKVDLISEISDHVNLLALNASIEAARAGEHGRGFAVVAEEISKLAEQTAAGAKSITEFVNEGLKEVSSGRSYVDATGEALEKIIGFITKTEDLVKKITESALKQGNSSREVLGATKQVKEMAENISASTHEQMVTNQEITKTIEQINNGTQSSAAAAEQIASSAEEISVQAESLRDQMDFFKV